MILREKFDYLFSTRSLTSLLRERHAWVNVRCLDFKYDSGCQVWLRDVEILAGYHVAWVARTQLPHTTREVLKRFFNLDMHSPIGDFLFTSRKVKRIQYRLSVVTHTPIDFQSGRLWYWKRETIWQLNGNHPLYLLEFF